MERRKFIAGLGSLTAAGAAAMGTGAVSSMESTRAVDADVVTDANGTLGIIADAGSLENAQVASVNNGQLELTFDGSGTSSGLNPDSTYHFDNVFQLMNQDPEGLHITFDKSQLDNPAAFHFYATYTGGSLIGSRDSDWSGQITSGNGVNIGITVETPDSVPADWETGTLVIRADHPEDDNVNYASLPRDYLRDRGGNVYTLEKPLRTYWDAGQDSFPLLMNKIKALSLLLLIAASAGFVSGSFGFTSVSAERGVSVQVVDDQSALVGYQSSDLSVQDGETVELVTVTNRLTDNIDVVDVTIVDGNFIISNVTTPTDISPGESEPIQGAVNCISGETQEVEVTVTVGGSGVTAQLSGNTETREFTLTCVAEQEETPTGTLHNATFNGAGDFEVNATNVGTTKIVYWTADKKWKKGDVDFTNQTVSDFDTSQKLQPQITGNTKIVAVYFPEFDITFVHPNYYDGNWGAGDATRVSGKHHPGDGSP